MIILHVNNYFHSFGGTEQYLYNVCTELKKSGHENVVIHGGSNNNNIGDEDIARKYHVPFIDEFSSRLKSELKVQIKSIAEKENPDIIYLHNINNPYVVEILTELGTVIKFVHDHQIYCPKLTNMLFDNPCHNKARLKCLAYAFRGNGYQCMGGRSKPSIIARKIREMFMNPRVYQKIDKFIVASQYMKQNMVTHGYQEDKIEVIPYFTNIPDNITSDANHSTILFIGRLCHAKGLDIFIESLALIKEDFQVIIIGNGSPDYIALLLKKINAYNLDNKVKLLGWLDNAKLSEYYKNAAFIVVPSIWPEPFGIVGIEAMAYSRAVIAFDVGGIPEWLKNGKTGFLIESGDRISLAYRMSMLLKNKSLREAMGKNAYERSSILYNKSMHIEKLLSVFLDAVNPAKAGAIFGINQSTT